ncbi:MAG: pilus assembly protein TadG-related protein [Desulfobaccales bacterium]
MRVLKALRRLVRRCNLAQGVKGVIADDSGAIALIMAFALTAFLGMAALAVDYGYMSEVQSELKKAAEAGALAGANALAKNADWNTAATSIVQENQAAGKLLTDCQVLSGYWSLVQGKFFGAAPQETPAPVQAIQVVVPKDAGNNGGPLQLSFAPIFGINTTNLSGTAVAIVKSSGIWSILETGNGTVSISNNANVGNANFGGDVGLNGDGPFSLSNNATVWGKAYLKTGCPKTIGNGAVVKGGIQQDAAANAILQQATQDATTTFNTFRNPSLTPATPAVQAQVTNGIINLSNNGTKTINGTNMVNVLNLTRLTLSNNATLILDAPAGGSFVIRDSGNFSLGNGSQIKLGNGGITEDRVTFVRTGTGVVSLSNNSILNGNILSLDGAISLSNNAAVNGVLVSGRNITLSNNSVTTKKTPSGWGSFSSGGGGGAALVQ